MKNQELYALFIDELKDMYDAEKQIVACLPKLVKFASSSSLKAAITGHLKETKNQVKRLEKIFVLLDMKASRKTCKAMEGLIKESDELAKEFDKSPTLDAAIISAAQKVEHYEMASYGTLRSFAKHLKLDKKISKLLQENLNEEGAADKKLTKVADGVKFGTGVNKKATVKPQPRTKK